jgi:ATP-dependent DNA ligase
MTRRTGIMLCYPFEEKRLARWSKPYICQPKLDGVRSRAVHIPGSIDSSYMLLTSEENSIYHMDHIRKELNYLNSTREFDGELYAHHLDFDEITSRALRDINPHPLRQEIEYHIFDIVNSEMQSHRTGLLIDLSITHANLEYVKFVPTSLAWSFEEVWDLYEEFVAQGYEGIIVREPFGFYKRARSTSIMKFKPKKSDTYKVIGYEEEISKDGVPKNQLGSLRLSDSEGNEFFVGSGFTQSLRQELWASRESLPGKLCTINYQHKKAGASPLRYVTLNKERNVPRFPVFVKITGPDEVLE